MQLATYSTEAHCLVMNPAVSGPMSGQPRDRNHGIKERSAPQNALQECNDGHYTIGRNADGRPTSHC
jgi:hypothetical protein